MSGNAPELEPESVGARLRRLRGARGLSQRALAGGGVSASYISRVESGARRPSVKALRILAPRLGVSASYLETGRDLGEGEAREMRLYDAELELRLADDPAAAEESLRGLLEEALDAGDETAVRRACVGLGLAAAHRGAYSEAIAQLEAVVASGELRPSLDADVYATLGRSYVGCGQPERAVQLFESCVLQLADDASEHPSAYIRFATYLSYALSDLGQLRRAREVLSDAIEQMEGIADPYSRVRLYWSQARLAADEGDTGAALGNIRRAIALLEASEDAMHLARAHLLCAEILLSEGQLEQAGSHLEQAEALLGAHGEAQDRAWLRSEQAKREARLGRAPQAITHAKQALALLGDDDPAEQGRAYWALAEGLSALGETDEADAAFRRADELLAAEGRYTAQLCRAWARALRAVGRNEEAFELLERAADAAARRSWAPRREHKAGKAPRQ
jgi:transcriptional regulator with XRE-family HTH domain